MPRQDMPLATDLYLCIHGVIEADGAPKEFWEEASSRHQAACRWSTGQIFSSRSPGMRSLHGLGRCVLTSQAESSVELGEVRGGVGGAARCERTTWPSPQVTAIAPQGPRPTRARGRSTHRGWEEK